MDCSGIAETCYDGSDTEGGTAEQVPVSELLMDGIYKEQQTHAWL